MIACRLAGCAGQVHALVVRAFLRTAALAVRRAAARNSRAFVIACRLASTARHGNTPVVRAFFRTAALAIRCTAPRNRRAGVIACRFASPARHGNTLVIRAFFRTATLGIGRTASRNRRALVVFRFFAGTTGQIHALAAGSIGYQFLRTGTGSRIRRIPYRAYRTDTAHTAAGIGFFGLTVGAVQPQISAFGRPSRRTGIRHALVIGCRFARTAGQSDAFVADAFLRRTAIGIAAAISGDSFAFGATARPRCGKRIAVRTPRCRFAVSRRATVFDAFVLRIVPAVARRARCRNTAAVHRFVARFASRASERRTRRAVCIKRFASRTALSVVIIAAFTSRACIAAVAFVDHRQTFCTAGRAADAGACRRKRTARFTAAAAVADLTARTGGARFVVAARFARRVQRSAVFAGFARGAVRIRFAFDLFAAALAVSQIAIGACALFAFFVGDARRIGFTRVFTMIARLAVRIGRTARRYTIAVAVRDLSRCAGSACRIRRAGNAFRIRRRGTLALFARGASRIVGAFERRTVAFAVGQLTRRARIFARAVVARFAGFALAQRRIPLTARFAALFTRRALASAVVVGNGISRTVACRVGRFARRTRTGCFIVFLPVGT